LEIRGKRRSYLCKRRASDSRKKRGSKIGKGTCFGFVVKREREERKIREQGGITSQRKKQRTPRKKYRQEKQEEEENRKAIALSLKEDQRKEIELD
jgi:hypothetical protein